MSGVISVCFGKSWIAAGWVYQRLLEDTIQLHPTDYRLKAALEDAIGARSLHFNLLEDGPLGSQVAAAIVQTARTTLDSSSYGSLQWQAGLDEEHQQGYRDRVAELLDLLEREGGGETAGVIIVSPEKKWNVPRQTFERLLADVIQLHWDNPELSFILTMAFDMKGLDLYNVRRELTIQATAAIIRAIRATLDPSSHGSLRWQIGLDEEGQRAYLAKVTELFELLQGDQVSWSTGP